MNGRLAALAARQGGVITRAQALVCGYDDGQLQDYVRKGVWYRIRRGAYTEAAAYHVLDEIGRQRVLAHAVLLSMGKSVVISHTSAALLHGFPRWGLDVSRLHVTRADTGAGRIESDVHHHVGQVPADDVVEVAGLPLVTPVRAVLETACVSELEAAVVVADSALRSGMVSYGELREMVDDNRQWPGARNAGGMVSLADGLAESVGESRTRYLMHAHGLPTPVLQQEMYVGGRLPARVDFFFPDEGLIVEFDGKVKYGGLGDDAATVVFKEKQREDALREQGYEVLRLVWTDLNAPHRTAHRIRQALDRAATPPARTNTAR